MGPEEGTLPDWVSELDLTAKKQIENTVGNAICILQRSDEWRGLRYDEFRSEPICTGAPEVALFDKPRPGPLDDYSIAHITQWVALNFQVRLSPRTVGEAAEVASKSKGRAHHPIREYLRSLTWDGVTRVDRWLTSYAGAPDTPYTSAVGRMWLIAAVARAMLPKSICKTMLILEGPQNAGKSTLLRRLCPNEDWFSDTPIDLGKSGADKYQALRGKWIVEIPELDGFKGRDARSIKSFVSSPVDNYRASYGRKNQDVPRQCVFAGTTNEDRYLADATGNVRFWPVRISRADVAGIERDRDQIWAEAFAYYMDGAEWHITDASIAAMATDEQEAREEEDSWLGAVSDWLRTPLGGAAALSGIHVGDVLSGAIGMAKERHDRWPQTRAGIIMRKLGFVEVHGRHRPRLYKLSEERLASLGPQKLTVRDDDLPF